MKLKYIKSFYLKIFLKNKIKNIFVKKPIFIKIRKIAIFKINYKQIN